MADKKIDGVIEAVRYTSEGKLHIIRAYLRRGPTWSDRVLLTRDELLNEINSGRNYVIGERVLYMAGTFDTSLPVQVKGEKGKEVFYTSQPSDHRDSLEGAPIF